MDPCEHSQGGRCDDCFWLPAGAQGVWAIRVAGLEPLELNTLRTFSRAILAKIAEESETAALLGLEDSRALHASALLGCLPALRWDLPWPDNAETLLEVQLDRELGRQLPASAEDFSREVALFFFQAVSG
ncbi:MAG: hypothetical protein JWM80_4975 [Cyanobacteria bacterium RYN_339]|nr:hypothetical protein [Cyanobacteria bacterium RYN_339]